MRRILFIFLLMVNVVCAENYVPAVDFKPLAPYKERQKPRDGDYVFKKDPNIWVYNREFAKRFAMPDEWVDNDLKGAVAIAFRMEKQNYESCGWGGDAKSCNRDDVCLFDVYLNDADGDKLQWATYKTSDWSNFGSSDSFIDGRTKEDYWYYYDNVNNKKYVRSDIGPQSVLFVFGKPSNQDILSKVKNMITGKIPDNRSFVWETGFEVMSYRRDFFKGLDIITGNACQIASESNGKNHFQIYFNGTEPSMYSPKYALPNGKKDFTKLDKDHDKYWQDIYADQAFHKIKVPDKFMQKVHQAYKNDETDSQLVNKVKQIIGSK